MRRPRYLKPVLITTTVLHGIEAVFGIIGAVLLVAVSPMFFSDGPDASYQMSWQLLILMLLAVLALPVGFTVTQWILYKKNYNRASLIVCLAGILPTLWWVVNTIRAFPQ